MKAVIFQGERGLKAAALPVQEGVRGDVQG